VETDADIWKALCTGEFLEDLPSAKLPYHFPIQPWWVPGRPTPTPSSIFNKFLQVWEDLPKLAAPPRTHSSKVQLAQMLKAALQELDWETITLKDTSIHCSEGVEKIVQWIKKLRDCNN
jgi:hypothetical protein